jgi:hypothetical protein
MEQGAFRSASPPKSARSVPSRATKWAELREIGPIGALELHLVP